MLCHLPVRKTSLARRGGHFATVAAVLVAVVAGSGLSLENRAAAADDVLAVVPEDALGVMVIHRLKESSDKVSKIAQQIKIPAPDVLALGKLVSGIQTGLDEKGDVAVAIFRREDSDRPEPAIYLPTTDYEALLKPFGPKKEDGVTVIEVELQGRTREFFVAKKGTYAILVAKHGSFDALPVFKAAQGEKGLAGGMSSIKDWVQQQDVAFIATPAGVKLGSDKILEQIEQARDNLGALGDSQQQEVLKAAIGFYESGFKLAKEEVSHAVLGLRVETEGHVHLASNTVYKSGGKISGLLADVQPDPAGPLTGLPAGPFFIAGGGPVPAKMIDEATKFGVKMMKSMPGAEKLSKEQMDELLAANVALAKHVRSASLVMGQGRPGKGIYDGTMAIIRVDDAKAFLAEEVKSVKLASKISENVESPFLGKMDVKEADFDGVPGLEMTMDIADLASRQKQPGLEGIYDKLFGEGGKLTTYMAAADAKTVVVAYVSRDNLLKMIKQVKAGDKGLAGDAAVAKSAALLAKGSAWQGYLSPKGGFDFVLGIAKMINPDEIPPLPEFPPTPPVALGIKPSATTLETDLVLPAETLEAIAGYVMRMQER